MKAYSRELCFVIAGLALAFTGCNKALNYEKTVTIGPGVVQSFPVEAPRQNQKVTVTFKSSAAPVDVYIVLEKDADLVSKDLLNFKKPEAVLNKLEKSKEGSVSADIPAKAAFQVIVAGSTKDTSVEVKITSK